MEQSLIDRINELARIAKERALTEEELEERERLRNEYRESFRRNMLMQLDNVYIVDENGNEVKVVKKDFN